MLKEWRYITEGSALDVILIGFRFILKLSIQFHIIDSSPNFIHMEFKIISMIG